LKFNEIAHAACSAGVVLNTIFFAFNLFNEMHEFLLLNILSALGCWVGVFSFGRKLDGDK